MKLLRCKFLLPGLLAIVLLAPSLVSAQTRPAAGASLAAWIQRAEKAQAAGDWHAAELAWRQVVAISPSGAAWGNLGNVLKREGRPRQAVQAFHEGLKREPRLSGLQLDLALVYFTQRQYAQAIGPLTAYVRTNPESLQGLELLGICQLNARQFAAAAVHLEHAARVAGTPDVALLYALASSQTMAGQTDAARQTLTRMLQMGSDSAPLHLLLGEAEFNVAHNAEALAEFQKALAIDPRLASVHFQLGLVQLKNRNYPAAIQAFSAELKLRPECAECYFERGSSEYMQHQDEAAWTDIGTSLKMNPQDHDAWYYRARLQLRKGEREAAVASLRRAIAVDGLQPASHYLLGRTLLGLGQAAAARQQLALADRLHQQQDQRNDAAFRQDFRRVLQGSASPVRH